MAKIIVSDAKIKALADAILNSGFFICGYGHFNLKDEEYEIFVKSLFQASPKKELDKLYDRLKI